MATLANDSCDLLEPGSFRDRTARVFYRDGRVCRALGERALDEWSRLRRTAFFARAVADGKLVATEEAGDHPDWAAVLRHETVPFVSYPYEWSFGMLQDAALLYLELLQAALAEGMVLKDGSSYNVQWHGSRPVFIDVPSFVTLSPGDVWVGYRQFCQLFLFPLFLQAYRGVPFQPWLRGRLDGISPEECRGLMSLRDLFRPGVFKHVVLQAWLQKARPAASAPVRQRLKAAGFHKALIEANVRGLTRLVRRLRWRAESSRWSHYEDSWSYSDETVRQKEAFVARALGRRRWRQVWDLGCNTGRYTRLAARHADQVIAVDGDHLAVERLYQSLRADGPGNVLPLLVDLADASPGQGWRGLERRTLADRGRPELVMGLALLHHLVIGANLPLGEVVDWLAGLGGHLVLEFATPQDPMVRSLLEARDEPVPDYDLAHFEVCLARLCRIVDRVVLGSATRVLYFAEVRG